MDIQLDDRLQRVIENAQMNNEARRRRDTVKYEQRLWKNAVIPYVIDESLG